MQFKNNDTMVSFRIPTDVDARMDWISDQKWTDKSSIYRDAVRK
jgi:predicted DNA-binding protein